MKPRFYSAYSPSSLPDVTAVEIALLCGKIVEPTRAPSKIAVNETAAKLLAGLYRQLSPGTSARCHMPAFGLVFISGTACIGSVSICWQCTNLYFYSGTNRMLYGFDPSTPAAQQLHAELCQLAGLNPESAT